MGTTFIRSLGLGLGASLLLPFAAQADTIDPETFSADIAVGESVTVRKTVVVEATGPGGGLIDVHFLIDTTGSMNAAIVGAKAAASDILAGLAGFGDLEAAAGVFGGGIIQPARPAPGNVINQALTDDIGAVQTAIDSTSLGNPDGGGDFPERGQDAVAYVADNLSWRPGSSRFIVALGDSSWNNDTVTDAEAIAALNGANATLIGLRFSSFSASDSNSDDVNFTESVEDLGGTVFETGTDPDDIVDAILAGVSGSFADYETVTVSDLGNGAPEIDVSTVCVSAAAGGACDGTSAVGTYTRDADRTFEFDVTFTRTAAGDTTFETYALVDGAITATEVDTFGGEPPVSVPEPGVLSLLSLGLIGSGLVARRRRRA